MHCQSRQDAMLHAVSELVCNAPADDAFAAIRASRNVTHEQLRACWGDASRLSLRESSGKGGGFFVHCGADPHVAPFLVKSLARHEHAALVALLPDYHAHLAAYPQSLLMRIYGVYSAPARGRLPFMLIENLLHNHDNDNDAPRSIFDIKGSSVNRDKPFMDKAWLASGLALRVAPAVVEQVARDAALLASHELMDYSLLVGVWDTVGARFRIGIIDFLQTYNTKKRLAHSCKAAVRDATQLSTVPPDVYEARFVEFISATFEWIDVTE